MFTWTQRWRKLNIGLFPPIFINFSQYGWMHGIIFEKKINPLTDQNFLKSVFMNDAKGNDNLV